MRAGPMTSQAKLRFAYKRHLASITKLLYMSEYAPTARGCWPGSYSLISVMARSMQN